ncbi:MAG: hypothetical protein ABEH58_03470 [Haloplanus sp.]
MTSLLRRDLRHGVRIARAEYVRSLRGYVRSKRRLAGLLIAALFLGGNLLVTLPTAYVLGRTARAVDAIPGFAPATTTVPVVLVALATLRTLERIGRIDAHELVLTTVHPRAVVLGLVGAEFARLVTWFGVPTAAVVAAFTLGLGSPVLPLSAALVALPLVAWAAVWGYAVGISGLRLLRRLPGARRVLKAVGIVAMLVVVVAAQFAGRYLVADGAALTRAVSTLTIPPIVDYAALAFVGTPLARPPSAGALSVLVALLALTPVGLAVATHGASRLWLTDAPVRDASSAATTPAGQFAVPRPFAWRKVGRIAWAQLVRARRHPQDLAHLVVALFFLGPLGTTLAESSGDALGALVAGAGVGVGAYLAGATFGLNPLGDDRPQLPVLLLTATPPRTLVRGRTLAGLAVGLPVAGLGAMASVLLGLPPLYAVGFALVGAGICVAAAAFAVGLGAAYPVYEERAFWGTETVVPSTLVMLTYIVVVGVWTALGLIATWFLLAGHLVVTPVLLVALGAYLALTAAVSYGSYRYAIRRYRRYTVG